MVSGLNREELSLQQIEQDDWGDPGPNDTKLIATVLSLRRKPINLLGIEDLRIMLGQQVGIKVLIPRALAILNGDPLAEGDLYPGDLLSAVVKIPSSYWAENPSQRDGVERIINSIDNLDDHLATAIEEFRRG